MKNHRHFTGGWIDSTGQLKPADSNMWALFGDVYAYQNEFHKALAAFSMSIWTDTKPNPDVFLNRCKASFALKKYALDYFNFNKRHLVYHLA